MPIGEVSSTAKVGVGNGEGNEGEVLKVFGGREKLFDWMEKEMKEMEEVVTQEVWRRSMLKRVTCA